MSRRLISSGSTFEQEIGFSRAVVDGEWVFVSGTTGFDYRSMTISDSLIEQTDQCLRNIESALAEAGAGDVCAAECRGVPRLLADPAEVLRRHQTCRDDDLGRPGRSAHAHRDRGDGTAIESLITNH